MKMKLKTKKIIKITTLSLMSTLLVVGTCYITDSKFHWVDKALGYFNNHEVIDPNEDITIENKGIRVRPVASVINSDGSTTKTFTYTIEPSDATIKDVEVSASYSDGESCASVLSFSVDSSKQEITVNCLGDFDKQITLKVKSKEWPEISASVKIDYEEKVKSITSSSEVIYYDRVIEDPNILELFTWNSSKCTIPKKDYTFSISGGTIDNISYSNLYFKLESEGAQAFAEAFAALTKEHLFTETLQNNYQNTQKVVLTTENKMPTSEDVWNLTDDNEIHKQLVQYWELGMDQDIFSGSYITYDVKDIDAICSNGVTYNFSIKVAASLVYNYSSCYTPITNIQIDTPSIIF